MVWLLWYFLIVTRLLWHAETNTYAAFVIISTVIIWGFLFMWTDRKVNRITSDTGNLKTFKDRRVTQLVNLYDQMCEYRIINPANRLLKTDLTMLSLNLCEGKIFSDSRKNYDSVRWQLTRNVAIINLVNLVFVDTEVAKLIVSIASVILLLCYLGGPVLFFFKKKIARQFWIKTTVKALNEIVDNLEEIQTISKRNNS